MKKSNLENRYVNDLKRLDYSSDQSLFRIANWGTVLIAIFFLILTGICVDYFISDSIDNKIILVLAAVIGGYMALNIGANDVANNMGPAVGGKVLTIITAVIIAAICEATGADVREVARAIGSDSRIGSKYLDSGPGFGGSCFKKDILNLVYLSKYFGLNEVASFWEGVVKLNYWHQKRISTLVVEKLFGSVSNKKIGILGFSFKANTNDTRESAAISICKDLIEEGAILNIHDPKVEENQISRDKAEVSS